MSGCVHGTTGSWCCSAATVLYSRVLDAAALQLGFGCMAAHRPPEKVAADHDLGLSAVHNRWLQIGVDPYPRWHLADRESGFVAVQTWWLQVSVRCYAQATQSGSCCVS